MVKSSDVIFHTPRGAAQYLRRHYPFTPKDRDRLNDKEIIALKLLRNASQIPGGWMSADDINDLIERWSTPE